MGTKKNIIYLLYFLSGISGLVYEIIWVRLVGIGLGSTVYAVSAVLCSFMAGLGVGAFWLAGRLEKLRINRLRLYSFLELAVTAAALLATFAINRFDNFQVLIAGIAFPGIILFLLKIVAAMTVVFLPAVLMGATLPVLTDYVRGRDSLLGHPLAILYGINTLGATAACLATDFLFVPSIGVTSTILVAAFFNLLAGLIAWMISAKTTSGEFELRIESRGDTERIGLNGLMLILVAAFCGFAGIAAEVVWTRLLLFFTGSRVQSFSVMLAVYLLFIGAGSLLASLWTRKERKPAELAGAILIQVIVWAVSIPMSIPLMVFSERALNNSLGGVSGLDSYGVGFLLAAVTMFIPCLALGASFPLITESFKQNSKNSATAYSVGRVYFANTAGSVLGSLIAGYFLLPVMGSRISLILIGWTGVAAAAVVLGVLVRLAPLTRNKSVAVKAALTLCAVLPLILVPDKWIKERVILLSESADNIILTSEGLNETVVVTEQRAFGELISRTLWTNGFSMSGTGLDGQRYMRLMAHLPMQFTGSQDNILLICYGVGNTLSALTTYENAGTIDVVELSRKIISIDSLFHKFNGAPLKDPRVRLTIGDGRNYLLSSPKKYDVITMEPPPPTHAGVVNLYSRDFYEICKERLNRGGMLCQWLPVNQMPYEASLSLIRAFIDVFPGATLWFGSGCDLIMLGGNGPVELQDDWQWDEKVKEDLRMIGVDDLYQFLALCNALPEKLHELTEGIPPTTDNNPLIEYCGGRIKDGEAVAELCRMSANATELVPVDLFPNKIGFVLTGNAMSFTKTLKKYAVNPLAMPDSSYRFFSNVPLNSPLLNDGDGYSSHKENRYLEYMAGADIPLVAAAFRYHEKSPDGPQSDAALRVIGRHFIVRMQYDKAREALMELYHRGHRDKELMSMLEYLRGKLDAETGRD